MDRVRAAFDADFCARLRDAGSESERPVFIFGLPRSGTTLVEQVLASHSQVHGAGELRLGRDHFEALGGGKEEQALATVATLDAETIRRLAQTHLEHLRALDGTAVRIVDKMPDNYLYLGVLAALFPRATFIHCRRDVRDVAVSCWMTQFRSISWANHPDHIAARFRDYGRLMQHWQGVLPVPLLEVRYEDMVADLEGQARRLIEACGLVWESACMHFHRTQRPVRTASVSQVRQPLYSRSVARWKHYTEPAGPLSSLITTLEVDHVA